MSNTVITIDGRDVHLDPKIAAAMYNTIVGIIRAGHRRTLILDTTGDGIAYKTAFFITPHTQLRMFVEAAEIPGNGYAANLISLFEEYGGDEVREPAEGAS